MASLEDARSLALALPETSERLSRGRCQWRVRDKLFVWERPLRPREVEALGDAAPDGPILGARVEHLGVKQGLLEEEPDVFFTTPHFEDYPAILVRLQQIDAAQLEEIVTEAWLARAPASVARTFLESRA